MDIYIAIQTNDVIIFYVYYQRYVKIDTQITYIKLNYKAITKIKSEIQSRKTAFY